MGSKECILNAIRHARDEAELRGLIDDLISCRREDPQALSLFIVNMMVVLQAQRAEEIPLSQFANIVGAMRIFREHRQGLEHDPFASMDF